MPRTVWALGFVSLFMDLSSEIIHSLLPLFLTVTLGASVATVGAIDGIAEATASISKVFSGWLSDRMGRRKPLILLGYGLAALSKVAAAESRKQEELADAKAKAEAEAKARAEAQVAAAKAAAAPAAKPHHKGRRRPR